MPGYDQAPVIVDAGCGRSFEVPDVPWTWDVNTEQRDDGEYVVERHLAVPCPYCGRNADMLSEPVEPYLFLHQGLSKRIRLTLSDPDVAEWVGSELAGVQVND